tara:strand:+ start:941 stop:1981 length:1041 start_codon:yes stop_codon:yes gene_type:complete
MADFTTANLPGANASFNTARDKFSTIKDTLKSNMEVDASSLTSTLQSDLLDFGDKLKTMIPELPDLPDINLQAELTSLQELAGKARIDALASLESKFGSGLSTQGVELDDLVNKANDAFASGEKISGAIPNFTIPAAGGDIIEKANEVLQADKDGLEELLSDEVNVEVTEEIKKITIESVEKKKTLVTYSKKETIKTTGGGSTTTYKDDALEPQGYIVKEDTEKDTVDTSPSPPAIELTPAERMGLTPAEYQRHKQLQKETQALTRELKKDPTFSIGDERKGKPTGGDEDLKESRNKRINELNDIRSKGKFRLKESNRLQTEGFSRAAALDAAGIRPASASELLRT